MHFNAQSRSTSSSPSSAEHYRRTSPTHAAEQHCDHITFLARLIEGDGTATTRPLHRANASASPGSPCAKPSTSSSGAGREKLNRLQVQNLFRLQFIDEHANVIFIGGVGLGKVPPRHRPGARRLPPGTLRAVRLRHRRRQHPGRRPSHRPAQAPRLRRYVRPQGLESSTNWAICPIDKTGADLLFQIISHRYECGSTVITTNRTFKNWAKIFNNDATLTSAVLDRLLHHAETVKIEGKSYRMKDRINEPNDTPLANPETNATTAKTPN